MSFSTIFQRFQPLMLLMCSCACSCERNTESILSLRITIQTVMLGFHRVELELQFEQGQGITTSLGVRRLAEAKHLTAFSNIEVPTHSQDRNHSKDCQDAQRPSHAQGKHSTQVLMRATKCKQTNQCHCAHQVRSNQVHHSLLLCFCMC